MSQEEILSGGQMTSVTRVGGKLYRSTGVWMPAVHQLLKHLEAQGFKGAPQVLGIDQQGREIVTFMEGEAGYFDATRTVPSNLWSDQVLVEAAKFLRSYHDTTASFVAPADAKWQFAQPNTGKQEVVCHNDFAPYNCIFLDGHITAVIDFDTAAPGPRLRDIAYAVYSFAPLFSGEKYQRLGFQALPDRQHKIQLFCQAYGAEYCDGIVDAIIERLQEVHQLVVNQAAAGDSRFQRKIDEGHLQEYEADIAAMIELRDAINANTTV